MARANAQQAIFANRALGTQIDALGELTKTRLGHQSAKVAQKVLIVMELPTLLSLHYRVHRATFAKLVRNMPENIRVRSEPSELTFREPPRPIACHALLGSTVRALGFLNQPVIAKLVSSALQVPKPVFKTDVR
jgi:hypothetical protein